MVCDEQLVKRALSGDEDAFRKLVEKYKAYVFAIILNLVHDRFEAENIAQEVFLQIYRSLSQYRFQNFKGWAGKIAANKALDWRRAQQRKPEEQAVEDWDAIPVPIRARDALSGAGNGLVNPEELILLKEELARLRKMCQAMPKMYRGTLEKFYLEGKSREQIACEEGTTVKTVESRLYRARQMIREKWEEGE